MTWTFFSTGKSGKREVAVLLVMFWLLTSCYLFFYIPPVEVKEYESAWSTQTWATFAWAAAAFGIDFVAKMGAFGNKLQSEPAPRVPLRRSVDQQPQARRQPDDGVE